MRTRRGPRAVAAYVRGAPGTYGWLLILFFTTVALHRMSPQFEQQFPRQRSMDIHELSNNPVRVLFSGALWIDSGHWPPYTVLCTVFHAQAEHRLGTLRRLVVCAAAHVPATLISEGALLWAVQRHMAPESAVNTLDIGVSYALAGMTGMLTYRIAPPWRYPYLTVLPALHGVPRPPDAPSPTSGTSPPH